MLVSSYVFTQNELIVIKQDTFALVTIASLTVDNVLAAQCDSVADENAYNMAQIAIFEAMVENYEAIKSEQAQIISNLSEIVKTNNVLTEIERTKNVQLQKEIKRLNRNKWFERGIFGAVLVVIAIL